MKGIAGDHGRGGAHIAAALHSRPFRRLWLVLSLSSLGDWLGLLATSSFAAGEVTGATAKGAAFGGVIAVRLLPALVLGPWAGVLADRLDRRHTMALCDALRGVLFVSIPVVGVASGDAAVAVGWTVTATLVIEAVGMVWAPAKDAAVPNLLPAGALEAANQLSLATTYGLAPVLAALFMAALHGLAGAGTSGWAGATGLALYFNAGTFFANALVVLFGIPQISRGHRAGPSGRTLPQALAEGWHYVWRSPSVRVVVSRIVLAFGGAGVVIGTGEFFARAVGGGEATFSLLFAALFAGVAGGVIGAPLLPVRRTGYRLFQAALTAAGGFLAALALSPGLAVAMPLCAGMGTGAGIAFLEGWTLLGDGVPDRIRGRVFSFVEAGGRLALLLAISLSSLLVGVGGPLSVHIGHLAGEVPVARLLLFAAGAGLVVAGLVYARPPTPSGDGPPR